MVDIRSDAISEGLSYLKIIINPEICAQYEISPANG